MAAGDRRTSPEATVRLTSRSASAVVFLRMGSSAVTAKPPAGRWPAFRWPPGGLGALPHADEAELELPRERPRTASPRCLAGRVRAPGPWGGRKVHLRSAVRRPGPPAAPVDLAQSTRQLADPAARTRPTAPPSGSPPCRDNRAYLRRGGIKRVGNFGERRAGDEPGPPARSMPEPRRPGQERLRRDGRTWCSALPAVGCRRRGRGAVCRRERQGAMRCIQDIWFLGDSVRITVCQGNHAVPCWRYRSR